MGRPPVIPVEKKTRIVLSILAGEMTIAEAARREKVSEQSIGRWKADSQQTRDVLPAAGGAHGWVADALGLEQRVQRLSHGVVVGIALAAHGGDGLGFGKALGVADGSILTRFNRSMQHRVVGARVAAR